MHCTFFPKIRSQYFLGILKSSPSTCQAISGDPVDHGETGSLLATYMKNYAFEIVIVIPYRLGCYVGDGVHGGSRRWSTMACPKSQDCYHCYQIIMTFFNKADQTPEMAVVCTRVGTRGVLKEGVVYILSAQAPKPKEETCGSDLFVSASHHLLNILSSLLLRIKLKSCSSLTCECR